MLNGLLVFLSMIGGVALALRLLRALLRTGVGLAEAVTASGLAEVSARRGDLTELAERQALALRARRLARGSALHGLLWVLLLGVPVVAGWTQHVYAAASVLWLVPLPPLRSSLEPPR